MLISPFLCHRFSLALCPATLSRNGCSLIVSSLRPSTTEAKPPRHQQTARATAPPVRQVLRGLPSKSATSSRSTLHRFFSPPNPTSAAAFPFFCFSCSAREGQSSSPVRAFGPFEDQAHKFNSVFEAHTSSSWPAKPAHSAQAKQPILSLFEAHVQSWFSPV